MRRVVLYMLTSLDGFIAGPNGEFDDYEPSEEEHRFANEFFGHADGIFFGRKTYEGFVSYWDTLDVNDPATPAAEREFATLFRRTTSVVFSRTLDRVGERAVVIRNNLAGEVQKLKAGRPDGYFALVCGPELLGSLTEAGLVDEYCILVKPTVQGRGLSLFGQLQDKRRLTLIDTRAFGSGTVMHRYRA